MSGDELPEAGDRLRRWKTQDLEHADRGLSEGHERQQ